MKILQDSRHQLRLKNTPSLFTTLFMLVWGSGFVGIPICMMAMLVKDLGVTTLVCDRPEPSLVNCEKQRSTFLGLSQEPLQTYGAVQGAEHQTHQSRDSDGNRATKHWVTITTSQGEETLLQDSITVNGVSGNPEQMAAIANQINGFVLSQESQLSFQSDNRLRASNFFMMGFISLFPLIGTIFLYSTFQTEELIFDRETGLLKRKRSTLLGPRHQDLKLHNITGVCIDTRHSDDSTTHQLNLLPKTLQTRPLMESSNLSQTATIQKKIQQFLNAT